MGSSAFDKFFEESVPHILEKIFFSLEYESYKTCLEVSHTWQELLISETYQKIGKAVFHNEITQDQEKLVKASKEGNVSLVRRLLLGRMLDVNNDSAIYTTFYVKKTPLKWAAEYGHKDVVKLLLARGANPNRGDPYGWTPLNSVAHAGQIST